MCVLVAVPNFGRNSVRWGCCATSERERGTSERANKRGREGAKQEQWRRHNGLHRSLRCGFFHLVPGSGDGPSADPQDLLPLMESAKSQYLMV